MELKVKEQSKDVVKRYYWMDLIRIFACFAVIIIHVQGNGTTANRLLGVWLHCSVPLFVMISGCNFLNPSRQLTIKDTYKKYIIPLLITFFSWSVLYSAYSTWTNYKTFNLEMIKTFFINTINGHYHMWYIWMTIGIYAIVVFLKYIVEKSTDKQLWYFCLLAYFYLFAKYITQFPIFSSLRPMVIDIRLEFVSGFVIYFILGYLIDKVTPTKKITIIVFALGLLGIIIDMLITVFGVKCEAGGDVYGYFSPVLILISISSYWLFSKVLNSFSQKHGRIIYKISRLTLGIYMSHVFVILLMQFLLKKDCFTVIERLAVSVAVFVVCMILCVLLDKNKFTRKIFLNIKG